MIAEKTRWFTQPYGPASRLGGLCIVIVLLAVLAGQSTPTRAAPVSAGNAFYTVHVEDVPVVEGRGLYTVTTGSAHPAGNNLNVLFGDGKPKTSFNTVRSYTTGTDYVQRTPNFIGNSDASTIWLSPYGTVTPLGATGYRTTYRLPGPPETPDALTIISDVNVNGTSFENSAVEVTTRVMNNGSAPVDVGIRYVWDFQIAKDDGPTLRTLNPEGAALTTEAEFRAPTFASFVLDDNDLNPNPPTFNVFGTVTDPGTITPPPTTPDLLQFVDWERARNEPFTYSVDTGRLITLGPRETNDSAVLYFFGGDTENAIRILASEQATVSASIFATALTPLTIALTPATETNRVGTEHTVTATVRDRAGNPSAGQAIGFVVDGANSAGGSATTADNGTATFTYTGNNKGADTITAWIDLNGNDQRELTEPSASARKTWEEPTAVTLIAFTADAAGGQVTLTWETGTEINNAGFNLYRATSAAGPYVRINDSLIVPKGDVLTGARYRFDDHPGAGYFYYKLEDVDYNGVSTAHGPVEVAVDPALTRVTRTVYLPLLVRN